MKFTIEVEDFWIDSEDSNGLEPNLTKFIIKEVVHQIDTSIKQRVEDHITRKVKADIEEKMYRFMNISIEEIIKTEKISVDKIQGSGKEEITLVDYIKRHFQYKSSYRNADEVISKEAEKFSKQMKDRYDLLFASQLVAKMSNAGMLKEDVAKILLEQPK